MENVVRIMAVMGVIFRKFSPFRRGGEFFNRISPFLTFALRGRRVTTTDLMTKGRQSLQTQSNQAFGCTFGPQTGAPDYLAFQVQSFHRFWWTRLDECRCGRLFLYFLAKSNNETVQVKQRRSLGYAGDRKVCWNLQNDVALMLKERSYCRAGEGTDRSAGLPHGQEQANFTLGDGNVVMLSATSESGPSGRSAFR